MKVEVRASTYFKTLAKVEVIVSTDLRWIASGVSRRKRHAVHFRSMEGRLAGDDSAMETSPGHEFASAVGILIALLPM